MVAVVQLVEHLVVVQDVAGSSPVSHPDIGSQLFAEALYVCAVACWCAMPIRTLTGTHTCVVVGRLSSHVTCGLALIFST